MARLMKPVKALITTAADDILICFVFFSENIRFSISCESSVQQTIHMKCQILFSPKNINTNKK